MDILKRQAKAQEQARILREEAAKRKADLLAANPKPPLSPANPPSVDVSKGIAFGTRRSLGKGRNRKSKKTIRRSKK